jgi:hypothetical protein
MLRIELRISESKSDVLPVTPPGNFFHAVRTGIEPIATDRQSVMLAFTPTNRSNLYGD